MRIDTWQKAPGQWRMTVEAPRYIECEAMSHALACCLTMQGFSARVIQLTYAPVFELDIHETDRLARPWMRSALANAIWSARSIVKKGLKMRGNASSTMSRRVA